MGLGGWLGGMGGLLGIRIMFRGMSGGLMDLLELFECVVVLPDFIDLGRRLLT
jgi:hypothetical protein